MGCVQISLLARPRAGAWARGFGTWVLLLGVVLLGGVRVAAARTEPGLLAVQRAALAHAGLSEGATTRLLVREHLSALLPQVRFTVGRGWQLSATGRPLDGLSAPTTVDDDHTSYAVSASWDLARLLAPHEALALHNAEPRLAQQRLALLVRVNGLFAARCHLLQEGQPAAAEHVAELEAALDLITGGHKLPAVTAATVCPAVPRLTVALPHVPAPRVGATSRRRPASSLETAAEDDRLAEASGAAEALEYGYE
jgi:hypothetical protein